MFQTKLISTIECLKVLTIIKNQKLKLTGSLSKKKEDKKNPFVVVWMVTYNHEKYIGQAIESIMMQQTNFDFKLLIGEDCSRDKTREICQTFQTKYPAKIELICNLENLGATANAVKTYQRCLESNAKYIALCEGDDYWTDPLKLQKQVGFLEKNQKHSGCFHYTHEVNESGGLEKIRGKYGSKLNFTTVDTFSETALFHTSSFIFRCAALNIPGWFDKVASGDMVIFSVVSAKGKLRCIPELMSIYRNHAGGITKRTSATEQNHHHHRIKLMQLLDEYHNFKYHKKALKTIRFHEYGLKGIYRTGPFAKFKNLIKKIIRY